MTTATITQLNTLKLGECIDTNTYFGHITFGDDSYATTSRTTCIFVAGCGYCVLLMHLSMLSPTQPSTGMGGALPRDLMQNYVPRVGHLT